MKHSAAVLALVSVFSSLNCSVSAEETSAALDAAAVDFRWGVKIPVRDGARLNATVYTPKDQKAPAPCIFTLTPYIAQTYHDRGVYFAAHGLPFLTVDVRGRGNSDGNFAPFIQEAKDGYDVVEWLARQPYCNGKISMWGGSYAGHDQWAVAKERPPHLTTIVPVASVYPGRDFPISNNFSYPYVMQWLTLTSGHASQDRLFGDQRFWAALFREWFQSGRPFKDLDTIVGNPSPIFQEWVAHPYPDAYWDSHNPTTEQYARLSIPILTITGSYDGDQLGALTYYREHMKNASPEASARHYLIIGPWDHAGTRTPQAEFGGLKFAEASLVDLPRLHVDWYAWTMQDGPKPQFLHKPVAYYVMGAEKWRYAETLEAVTAEWQAYLLESASNANDVFFSGSLLAPAAASSHTFARGAPDHYVYDPRDLSGAELESRLDRDNRLIEQRLILANRGKELVYHSAPFAREAQLSGVFRFSAWIAIDQPDTDFAVAIYEIAEGGGSIYLTGDSLRARYRENLREPKPINTKEPLRYDFTRFNFVSRQVKKGSRLRLVVAPINSIYRQKNYNSGGEVAAETMQDARSVTVKLYHDRAHPSALYVPFGHPEP